MYVEKVDREPVETRKEAVMKTAVHLQRDILDELDWEPSVDAAHIGVTVNEGVVTLAGHVSAYPEKHAAEVVTKRIHGVRAVANKIEVRPIDAHVRDDEEIASAALHALEWDVKVPSEQIQVSVEGAWITLEGTVEQQFQKVAAERAVRHLLGARGVTNAIVVAPRELSSQVKAMIEAAFARSAALKSKELAIEMAGATVTLTGDVHSHTELDEAERIAWAAEGVIRVENCITLTPWGCGPCEEWGY
jgi:osmotically-inducible protein OsmY